MHFLKMVHFFGPSCRLYRPTMHDLFTKTKALITVFFTSSHLVDHVHCQCAVCRAAAGHQPANHINLAAVASSKPYAGPVPPCRLGQRDRKIQIAVLRSTQYSESYSTVGYAINVKFAVQYDCLTSWITSSRVLMTVCNV